jgi:signal transduction histidine kinase
VAGRDLCGTIFPAEQCGQVAEGLALLARGRTIRGMESTLVGRDGDPRAVAWNLRWLPDYEGQPAVLAVGHDITDLKRAQERVLQAERLAAIGQMMAGLAHESRNALQRSQACLELLALKVQNRPDLTDLIHRTQAANDHLYHLYEDVRGYAAPIKLELGRHDLAAVWREAWHHLEATRGGRVAALREELGGLDLVCSIDPFRMNQVFRNVMENALAACRDPVEVRVRCAEAELGSRPAVRVSVRDNGPGLTSEQTRRIFEPFFTTKTKGTGLGMAISRRIAEAHGGLLTVGDPAGGPGAEIVLVLPRDEPPAP